MNDKCPTWSIVTTCSEPKSVIERFVAHHLSLEVKEIFLFFDNPTDLAIERLSRVPRLTVVPCDEAYWRARKGGRPSDHRQRQIYNANYAARNLLTSDWLANIDTDEYLFPRNAQSISEMLADTPDEFNAVRVLPAEHIFKAAPVRGSLQCDGIFKLKAKNRSEFSRVLFREMSELFPSGFLGHEVGKSFQRASSVGAAVFNVHFVRSNGTMVPTFVVPQEQAVLLHSFPSSFEDFRKKFERRLSSKEYMDSLKEQAQAPFLAYDRARKESGEEGAQSFFLSTSVLSDTALTELRHMDLIIDIDLKFSKKIREHVKPYEKKVAFLHLSQPSGAIVRERDKVFQIGMNRAGSKEICAELSRAGYSFCHWDEGHLAKALYDAKASGAKPFDEYSHYEVISDISVSGPKIVYDGFLDFSYIIEHFPESIFLLNYRPVEDWINSRSKFRRGKYLAEARDFHQMSSDEEVKNFWRQQWDDHWHNVKREARERKLRLIEYPIYSASPGYLVSELARLREEDGNV